MKWSLLSASPSGIGTGTVLAGTRAFNALAPLIAVTPSSSRAILAPTLPKVLTPKRAIAAAPTKKKAAGGRHTSAARRFCLAETKRAKYRAAGPQRKKFFPPGGIFFCALLSRQRSHSQWTDSRPRPKRRQRRRRAREDSGERHSGKLHRTAPQGLRAEYGAHQDRKSVV